LISKSEGDHVHRILPVGLGLLVIGTALFVFAIYWERYAGGGLYALGILFLGMFLAMYQAGLERGGHQKLWVTRARDSTSPLDVAGRDQFETEVLNNTTDLANRLGIKKFLLERVVWGPSEDQIRNVGSRECHIDRNELVLSSRLKNVLTSDDWTPLIAVSLIYEKKLMPGIFRKRQVGFFVPWVLGLAGLGVLMSLPGNSIVVLLFIFWLFIPLVVAIRRSWRTDLRMRFIANAEAGDLVGRDRLATVLAKIGESVPEQVAPSRNGDPLPTIGERLSQLEPSGTGFQDPSVLRIKGTLQMKEQERQARSKGIGWRKHKRFLFTMIFLVCLIAPVTAFIVWDNSVCPEATIIPTGTQVMLGPMAHADYPFLVSNVVWNSRPVWGSFAATQPVTMYVMTSSEFQSFNSTGSPGTYLFSSGPVSSATYQCGGSNCPPEPFAHLGQEFIVLYNLGGQASARVTITQEFLLGGC
jgi:hypothetical protein